jgi:hypothetical protein
MPRPLTDRSRQHLVELIGRSRGLPSSCNRSFFGRWYASGLPQRNVGYSPTTEYGKNEVFHGFSHLEENTMPETLAPGKPPTQI